MDRGLSKFIMRDMWILRFECIVSIQTHVKTINGSEVTIRIDNRSWSYSRQGELWCPLLGRVVYNLSTWCNFFHSSRYGVMCGDKAQGVRSYIQKWHVRTLLIHECGWMMLWLLCAFWRDHHTTQTWYRCSSSSK